jgi:hypothetical protein
LYSCVCCHYDTVTVLVSPTPGPVHSSVAKLALFVGGLPLYPPLAKPEEELPEGATLNLAFAILLGFVVQEVPFQSSVAPVGGGVPPPKAIAEPTVPVPPNDSLAVFIEDLFVHEVPFHSSVAAETAAGPGAKPPNAKATEFGASLLDAKDNLAVFNPVIFVQDVLLKVSAVVLILKGGLELAPPNAKAAVLVPLPAASYLLSVKLPVDDQEVPLYLRVVVPGAPGVVSSPPPNTNPAVNTPTPIALEFVCGNAVPVVQDVPLYCSDAVVYP